MTTIIRIRRDAEGTMTPAGRNYIIDFSCGFGFSYEVEAWLKAWGGFEDITLDSEGSHFFAYSVSYDRALFVANHIAQHLDPIGRVVVDDELVAFLRSVGCAAVSSADGVEVVESGFGFEVRKANEALLFGYLSVWVESREEADALAADNEVEDERARWEMESERAGRDGGWL